MAARKQGAMVAVGAVEMLSVRVVEEARDGGMMGKKMKMEATTGTFLPGVLS